MGYVADRWHKSRPSKSDKPCGDHKGKVASASHGKGKRWQARYTGPDGKERTSLHRTQVEAEREVTKQESAKLTGSWLDPKAGEVTVRRYTLDTWLPAQDIIERTRREYLGVVNRYLFPDWGNRQIRSIKPSEAAAWQSSLTSKYGLGGSTPHRAARYVRSIFRFAVTDRVISVSPFDGIKGPRLTQKQVSPPDVQEVIQLIQHAYHPRWATMIELCALTGLRSGEVRGLKLEHLHTLSKSLDVVEQLAYEPGSGLHFDRLKTDCGRRSIPLTQRVVDLLARYLERYPPAQSGEWAGLIFRMPTGKPVGESTLDWALKSICRSAGVKPRCWHELRHHYASVLIAGGENPRVVQQRLGHKDVLTTLRVYSHLFDAAEDQTRGVLDAAWSGQPQAEFTQPSGRMPESRGKIPSFSQLTALPG